MFYTYILKSEYNNSYYIGSCQDFSERLALHNGGKVQSTKRWIPWKLIYKEEFENLEDARNRESQIKNWKSRKAVERLIYKGL